MAVSTPIREQFSTQRLGQTAPQTEAGNGVYRRISW
ncbi:MAG: hypothetical protein ACD_75C02125G0001 [uncultured bacterium]|nr:MAG: hypothetical protein ACD_75C02125G0001 [uncultured bacterium]